MTGFLLNSCCVCKVQLAPDNFDGICSECEEGEMSSITWEEVADGPFVGGDLETVEDGQIYRGPISAIWISDGYFNVSSEWVATMKDGAWVEMKSNNNVNVLMSEVSPIDIGDGRIRFSIPYLGAATLFPRGGSKLERPKPVSGS